MSETTPRLSLPIMMAAQSQKSLTHNAALEILDIAVNCALTSLEVADPPAAEEGESWAIPPGATGSWAGQEGRIASWRGGGWLFHAPRPGWIAWVEDAADLFVWTGTGWERRGGSDDLDGLGIGTSFDAVNRLSLASDACLLSHAGAGHRVKVNKAAVGETASLLFQSDWSGRAEIGLAGEDDLSIKVSADGSTWATALSVDGGTAAVTLGAVLRLTPGSAPAAPAAGCLYFDSVTSRLRCHDGSQWHDLF